MVTPIDILFIYELFDRFHAFLSVTSFINVVHDSTATNDVNTLAEFPVTRLTRRHHDALLSRKAAR